jgi:hypothetical protein
MRNLLSVLHKDEKHTFFHNKNNIGLLLLLEFFAWRPGVMSERRGSLLVLSPRKRFRRESCGAFCLALNNDVEDESLVHSFVLNFSLATAVFSFSLGYLCTRCRSGGACSGFRNGGL